MATYNIEIENTVTPKMLKIQTELPQVPKRIVDKVTDRTESEAKSRTPRSGMTFAQRQKLVKDPSRKRYNTASLASSIKSRRDGDMNKYSGEVYYDKMNGWRHHFLDKGTKNISGREFVGDIKDSAESYAEELIEKEFREVFS